MTVSRETSERLEIYASMLQRWNPHINLVASSTLNDLEARHIKDSLQLTHLASPEGGVWADLGSGGGLPGLIIAIAFAGRANTFVLVESDQRKAAFLRAVVRETELTKVTVLSQRIEAVQPLNAEYVSARALAPLGELMAYLDLHLAPSGKAFLMKGRQWRTEVEEAAKAWSFDYTAHPSHTQDGAAILEISGVKHGA
jgi:16S rRNA (guanine527-N7)-methyltransferase